MAFLRPIYRLSAVTVRPVGLLAFGMGAGAVTTLRFASTYSLLTDAAIKAALKPDGVARDFIGAIAPLLHEGSSGVMSVEHVDDTTVTSIFRDVRHDVALKYTYRGTAATVDVMSGRALLEAQREGRPYLAARSLAHVGAHFIRAVHERADAVGKKRDGGESTRDGSGVVNAGPDSSQTTAPVHSGSSKPRRDDSMYAAYVAADAVHLVMLCDFAFAYDPEYTFKDTPLSLIHI